ncbi:hypothetical protein D7I41_08430 [Ochrobactrum sp. MH181795]|uniref:Uncharacterized protein n=1 Tax=Brucella lupini TaxID=255457 RepID=A0A256GRG1_9HYPH|nr:hypothetical protein CES86_2263 [Brucella lupini]RCI79275.1 hypothetical protein DNK03_13765 [Brucella anthropi]RNL45411.1 hypothetical protein D7I41_08430 [Ochrobactrum sp. MH181795]HBQ32707.1 hypothetical protein [Brucella anthropi]
MLGPLTDPVIHSGEHIWNDVRERLTAVQVKEDEDQNHTSYSRSIEFKVLEFLGQKKAAGQIPTMLETAEKS